MFARPDTFQHYFCKAKLVDWYFYVNYSYFTALLLGVLQIVNIECKVYHYLLNLLSCVWYQTNVCLVGMRSFSICNTFCGREIGCLFYVSCLFTFLNRSSMLLYFKETHLVTYLFCCNSFRSVLSRGRRRSGEPGQQGGGNHRQGELHRLQAQATGRARYRNN